MANNDSLRKPILPDRIRTIPGSFSWIDRNLLHRGFLKILSQEEMLLYFFLVLVAGPEGTSYWGYQSIAQRLKITEDELRDALGALVRKNLVAFRYPTFQVLSLPEKGEAK
jgi:hypothetical protein